MSRGQFLACHNSIEISELMAFDSLKDDDYRQKLESKTMSENDRNSMILKMFKG